MINGNKCPHCERVLSAVNVEHVSVKQGLRAAWNGASFGCPHCRKILSVAIDPIAVKTDIVNEVVKKLRGKA